jgi:hypothetical protein
MVANEPGIDHRRALDITPPLYRKHHQNQDHVASSLSVSRGPELSTAAGERQAPRISGLSALGIRPNSLRADYPPADFIDRDLHPLFG